MVDYSTYSPGQGKGFPEATPLPSVGSVNRFSRRAIARRAVVGGLGSSAACGGSCGCPTNDTLNLVNGKTYTLTIFSDNSLWFCKTFIHQSGCIIWRRYFLLTPVMVWEILIIL